MTELKSQIYELKKNQIDADSIYRFLGAFNEVYSECTDAEKKQFMQAFIESIDIFPERREDGNWIQNIKFQFSVPIIKEGKEVAQIKGISLDKEKSDEHMASLSCMNLMLHSVTNPQLNKQDSVSKDYQVKDTYDLRTIGIHPGIVAGRLQHEGFIAQNRCSKLKEKYVIDIKHTA